MKHFDQNHNELQALSCYVKLQRAANSLTGRIHRHLAEDNLTQSQFAVLEALYHLGPLCQSELGRKILKSNANLTTVVDGLEKKQLVLRDRTGNDRRRINVVLTPDGEALISRVFPHHAAIIEQELAVLSTEEQAQLSTLLRKLGRGSLHNHERQTS